MFRLSYDAQNPNNLQDGKGIAMNCKQLFSNDGKRHWLTEKNALEHNAKMIEGDEIEYVKTLFFMLWDGEGEDAEPEDEELVGMEAIYTMSEELASLYWDMGPEKDLSLQA
tara:strand:+ start:329 stop:661 length:333 start_codon:yes stop_codon:yes gene_type:complete